MKKQHERLYAHREKQHPSEYHHMNRQCAYCKRVAIGDKWFYAPLKKGLKTTHGICPKCSKKLRESIINSDQRKKACLKSNSRTVTQNFTVKLPQPSYTLKTPSAQSWILKWLNSIRSFRKEIIILYPAVRLLCSRSLETNLSHLRRFVGTLRKGLCGTSRK